MKTSVSRALSQILATVILAAAAFAQQAPPVDRPPETAAQATSPVPAASRPAAKSGETVLRDPFWPVGYHPRPQQSPTVPVQVPKRVVLPWPRLVLKGITRQGNKYSAILQGVGIVEEGDVISLRRGNLIYRWSIDNIAAKNVSHTKLDVRAAGE